MHIWNCLILLIVIYLKVTDSNELTPLVLQGFLPMTGSGWPGGGACLPAVEMALRHINSRAGLLDGYNLTYTYVDTKVTMYKVHLI